MLRLAEFDREGGEVVVVVLAARVEMRPAAVEVVLRRRVEAEQHGDIDGAVAGAQDLHRRTQVARHRGLHLGAARLVQSTEEHTSEPQPLMPISYAVFCLK